MNLNDKTFQEILNAALNLSVAERLRLIELLARSLRQELGDDAVWDGQSTDSSDSQAATT